MKFTERMSIRLSGVLRYSRDADIRFDVVPVCLVLAAGTCGLTLSVCRDMDTSSAMTAIYCVEAIPVP